MAYFLDDGISSVTMDRSGFNDMMEQLAAAFVKDISRLAAISFAMMKVAEFDGCFCHFCLLSRIDKYKKV